MVRTERPIVSWPNCILNDWEKASQTVRTSRIERLGVRGTSRAAPPPCFAALRESERRAQTAIPLHPSPLTPGPSPTTASLADARGAAGERGENVVFYRSDPYIDSAGADKSQFAICIVQFAICNLAAKVWRLQLRGGGPKSGIGIRVVPPGLARGGVGTAPQARV